MECGHCKGEGSVEYDAGLLVIGCKACSGIGKVDEPLTKEEFEKAYAFRSDMVPDQVTELGLVAVPSDCGEGWAMEKAPIPEPVPHVEEVIALPPESPDDTITLTDKGNEALDEMTALSAVADAERDSKDKANKVAFERLSRLTTYKGMRSDEPPVPPEDEPEEFTLLPEEVTNEPDTRGDRRDNIAAGSPDTGKPKQPRKPKAKKRTPKKPK